MNKRIFSAPLYVCWDLTYQCNLKCIHCCFSEKNTPINIREESISLSRIFKILDELDNIGVNRLEIAGGEPLLFPHFHSFIEYASKKQYELSLVTNGILLNEELIFNFKKNNLAQIQISLDGYEESVHEFIRGTGTFQKTLKAIKLCVDNNINLVVAAVIYRGNYSHLSEFADFLFQLGVKAFRVQFLLAIGSAKKNFQTLYISENEQNMAIDELLNNMHVQNKELNIILPCFYNKQNKPIHTESTLYYNNMCGAGIIHANINPYGDVTACTMLTDEEWIEGNINTSSFSEVWLNKNGFKLWRNNYTLNSQCKNCIFIKDCCKGCKALTFTKNNETNWKNNALCYAEAKKRGS